jgi:integrase
MGSNMGRRQIHKLSALEVKNAKIPHLYGDGGGLILRVTKSGSKSWIFRYRRRDMGLGAYPAVSLEDARRLAADARKKLVQGIDPIETRQAKTEKEKRITFAEACRQYIDAHAPGWKNAKHRQQWENTLHDYAEPILGKKDVRDITADDCLRVLSPIWTAKSETASRLRGRMENVLDWCAAKGYRDRNAVNPASWRGNLKHLLAGRPKKSSVRHHSAMDWRELPAFMRDLRQRDGLAARALELLILTCARTSEVLLAERSEIVGGVWTIPAARMKGGLDHRVPLVPQALELLINLPVIEGNPYLFPGQRQGRPLSNMAMEMMLRRMGRGDITVHGFRSTFRDWAAERTSFPREIAEMCLAHLVGNEVERAYRRSELLEKRRDLLATWSDYCLNGEP